MKTGRWGARARVLLHLAVLRPLVRLYCGVHVSGSAHLHDVARFILIANHNSHLDVLLLYSLLSARDICRTHVVADEPYFARHPLVHALVNLLFQPVWIRRGEAGRHDDPLQRLRELLERGENIVMFPEGTRGQPGEMQPFKSGVGRLVSSFPGVPIVPVFLSGPERILPKGSRVPLPIWSHVLVGPPQACSGSAHDITHHLENTLRELSRSGAARCPARRRRRAAPAPLLAVLGIDGSGKSTVARGLALRLSARGSACLVGDRLEVYEQGGLKPLQPLGLETARGLLNRYAKGARSLARYKIPKLAELLLRDRLLSDLARFYAPHWVVLDGSPLLNMAAWASLYGREDLNDETLAQAIALLTGRTRAPSRKDALLGRLPELRRLRRLGLTHLRLPKLVVLLNLTAQDACARIAARGKPRQAHETEDQLGRLAESYRRVVRVVEQRWSIPVLQVDAARPLDDILAEALHFVEDRLRDQDHEHEPPY